MFVRPEAVEQAPRTERERGEPLDREDLGGQVGQDGGLVAAAGADLEDALGCPSGASSTVITATMYGWLIVCSRPIGTARSAVGVGRATSGGGTRRARSAQGAEHARVADPALATCRTIAAPGAGSGGLGSAWPLASSSWKSLTSSWTSRRPFHSLIDGWKATEQACRPPAPCPARPCSRRSP